jgi:hypothetical protein
MQLLLPAVAVQVLLVVAAQLLPAVAVQLQPSSSYDPAHVPMNDSGSTAGWFLKS